MFYPSKPVVILILFIVLGPFLASSRKINLEKTFLKSQPRKSDMPSNTEADEDTEAIENIANLFSSIIGKNASTETAIKGTDGFHFQNPVADLGSELQTFSTSAVNVRINKLVYFRLYKNNFDCGIMLLFALNGISNNTIFIFWF